jgi:hypothetical protein
MGNIMIVITVSLSDLLMEKSILGLPMLMLTSVSLIHNTNTYLAKVTIIKSSRQFAVPFP